MRSSARDVRTDTRWWWGGVGVVMAATLGVYWSTLQHEFVTWDDGIYLYNNELVTGEGGLGAIWENPFSERPHKRNPMVFTTFWLEHRVVGLNPGLYHADQFVLHALNAALLLLVFRRLGAPLLPSILAALLFGFTPSTSLRWRG